MKKRIRLMQTESIVAVVPEGACGPGWANTPVWVHISDAATGRCRVECLQPDEQTAEMRNAYRVCAAAHALMKYEAERLVSKKESR